MAFSPADATSVSEPLYKEEFSRALHGRNGGITAVTFYDGEAVAAAAYAKGKLREVLEANPWIAGQLVKQALVHPKAGASAKADALVGELFSVQSDPAVHEAQVYVALNDACVAIGVKNAASLRKTKARVTKVVVPVTAGGSRWLSRSHTSSPTVRPTTLSRTCMLSDGAPIRSLSATRKHKADLLWSQELKAMLPADYKWTTSLTIVKATVKV